MQPHEQRVVEERDDLIEKNSKLSAFFGTELFNSLDGTNKKLLIKQQEAMLEYIYILDLRIALFA